MKIRKQIISKLTLMLLQKVIGFIIISILTINSSSVSLISGAEKDDLTTKSTWQEKLTLVYNEIDASNFPKIVSIVSVMNDLSFAIGVLNENNFEVREDGVRELPITVELIAGGDMGVNVALLIDCSGSMLGQPITDAKYAASAFIDLMQSRDQAAVVSFSNQVRTEHVFSNDKNSLKAAISKINSAGGTAIFDALIHAVYLMSATMKNRAIILLSDGADKDSYYSAQQALNALLSHEVRTFTIGLGLNQNSPEENILKDIASQTGGLYFYSPTSGDLKTIYEAIYKLLHSQYRITYTTHNPAKDGMLRHVKIDVFVNSYTSSDTASYRAPYEGSRPDLPPGLNFEVVPNPFTPNDDGLNDWTEFRKGDGIPDSWDISIMDRMGRLIKHLRNGEAVWDGKDEAGLTMLPGTYLYIVFAGNQPIHRGLIQLIR